jgi:hypothetical protein
MALRVFDDVPRSDGEPATYSDTTFGFLNRVAGAYWDRLRALIETWFERLCDDAKPNVLGRLRSGDDRQFDAAFWELYCHESLLRLGYSVECEPEMAGSGRRPDFLAENADGRFLLEATVCASADEAVAAERRQGQVFDALNQTDTPNFFLHVEVARIGEEALAGGPLRREVEQWLATLDPDEVAAVLARGGSLLSPDMPTFTWEDKGWGLVLRPLPKKESARGQPGLRPIGMSGPGSAYIVDDVSPLKRAVREKASAYGELEVPYIVAVLTRGFGAEDFDVKGALFGSERITLVDTPAGGFDARTSRDADGAWYGPRGAQNRRVSAVLIARRLTVPTAATAELTLWHHPAADRPVRVTAAHWRDAVVTETGELVFEPPTTDGATFFGLTPEWPGPDTPF